MTTQSNITTVIEGFARKHKIDADELAASFRAHYSSVISGQVKRAMEQRVLDGHWPGRAPIGYRNIHKDIVQDPMMARAVYIIFESRLDGLTCEEIIARLYDEGLDIIDLPTNKLFNEAIINKVLRNTFYYGVMNYNGEQYPHRYEPIISKKMFDQVQHLLWMV